MSRAERMSLIKEIEGKFNSRLLIYIAGDRKGLETKISSDVFPMFHRHLTKIGSQKRIDLYLYSTGGITIAGYALVNLIREFCEEFNVIIPFKAMSTATLIALGSNQIIITPMGQLSPIDPSVIHPLGPTVQMPGHQTSSLCPVNVEDVNGYFDMAKKEAGLQEENSMKTVFELLSTKINPLVLGAVQRSRDQISFLAKQLMKYHTDDDKKIESVVNALTRERFSHDYVLSRKEAKDVLGLNIVEPDEAEIKLIIDLFNMYSDLMKLNLPYHPETELGTKNEATITFNRGIIETNDLSYVFKTVREIKRLEIKQPNIPVPMIAHQERLLQEEWVEDNTI